MDRFDFFLTIFFGALIAVLVGGLVYQIGNAPISLLGFA